MNDEANTHYFGMLDQLLEGHLWIQENLPGEILFFLSDLTISFEIYSSHS